MKNSSMARTEFLTSEAVSDVSLVKSEVRFFPSSSLLSKQVVLPPLIEKIGATHKLQALNFPQNGSIAFNKGFLR